VHRLLLCVQLPEWSAGTLPLMVLYPRNRHLTAKVNAFALWVKEVFDAEFAGISQSASELKTLQTL
jgi:DNA-binding transcriptional LysR family regulator